MFDRKYVSDLENLIMDDLMPMYLIGCRVSGVDPRSSEIMGKLMSAMNGRTEMPMLLKEWDE